MVKSHELNNTITELETQVEKFKSISELYYEILNLKLDLVTLKDQSKSSSGKIKIIIEKLDSKLAIYENLLSELTKDNKIFQKELEQYITSKLEMHKSDIQVEIRNEGVQIQRGFENSLTQNFNNLQSKMQDIFSKHEKQINLLKTLAYIIIVLCFGLGIKLLLK